MNHTTPRQAIKAAELVAFTALVDDAVLNRGGKVAAKYVQARETLKVKALVGKLPADVAKEHYFCCPCCGEQWWSKWSDELLAGEICYECDLIYARDGKYDQELERLAADDYAEEMGYDEAISRAARGRYSQPSWFDDAADYAYDSRF